MNALLLAALLLSAPPWPPKAWQVVVATEGGFSGKGKGGVAIDSEGSLWVSPYVGPRCHFQLTPEELERMNAAVAVARPVIWTDLYALAENPRGCCDQYRTKLFLTAGHGDAERQYWTSWFDDSRRLAPMDAQRLQAAALGVAKAHPCQARQDHLRSPEPPAEKEARRGSRG